MKRNNLFAFFVIGLVFLSCGGPAGLISYPYTGDLFDYMGFKSGLTSSSSNQAFHKALEETIQAYHSISDVVIDGINYELINRQQVIGGIPNTVWNTFWKKLDNYSFDFFIGSCYYYFYAEVPLKGETGTGYQLYTIVRDIPSRDNPGVYPITVKCSLIPTR